MTENVTNKLSLPVKLIKHGVELSVFLGNGYVMVILTVLTVLMKTQPYITVQLLNRAPMINSLVLTEDVSTKYVLKSSSLVDNLNMTI